MNTDHNEVGSFLPPLSTFKGAWSVSLGPRDYLGRLCPAVLRLGFIAGFGRPAFRAGIAQSGRASSMLGGSRRFKSSCPLCGSVGSVVECFRTQKDELVSVNPMRSLGSTLHNGCVKLLEKEVDASSNFAGTTAAGIPRLSPPASM